MCAFCAHRLGQARKPSHVQRRFLQSSRPLARPPAEAAALKEDDGQSAQPSWGRGVPARRIGLGPSASWGKPAGPGGVPPGPASNWGGGIPAGNGIFAGRARQQADSLESGANGASSLDDLLPHERRAREINIERENARKAEEDARKAEAERELVARRLSLRVRGVGPAHTRGGRPLPRVKTEEERIAEAQREKARQKAFENWTRKKETQEHMEKVVAERQGPIVRHVLGDFDWKQDKSTEKDDNSWGQLRTRPQNSPSAIPENAKAPERSKSPASLYAEGRAQREEEARSGRYTPIGVRRVTADRNGGAILEERPPPGSRSLDLSKSTPQPERSPVQPRLAPTNPMLWTAAEPKNEGPVKFTPMFSDKSEVSSQQRDTRPGEKKVAVEEKEEEERTRREKPRRKARTKYEDEKPVYDDMPRGRGKDKAKRRQQFARTEEDELAEEEAYERAEAKRLRKEEKAAKKAARAVAPTPILLPEFISVSNLATALRVRLEDFVYKMQELGFEETSHDYVLNAETSGLIAQEYNFEPIIDRGESEDLKAREPAPDQSILPSRPPVVTIMGHVDHGKTTLLDYLRKSSVAAGEHGGITQHIGAFSVPMPSGKVITFLDTPGHAAFLSMRQRGANVTDIVILVVAADDSVKPQTIEAINHAKAAKVPIIVAINKIDKEDSNIDRVKQDLARHGVDVEDFGGDTQVVCVSGKTGQGMDELEEAAVTLSEILDHRAERDGPAEGWMIEASIKSMGKVATVLVRRGTMRPGDFIVAGKTWARIRCLRNEAGIEIDEAGPGTPVEIDGWREQPEAGDEVLQAPDEGKAKSVVDYRLEKEERDRLAEDMEAINENRKAEQDKREREKAEAAALAESQDKTLSETGKKDKSSGPKEIYFIIKGDVSGSVEAVIDSIAGLGNNEVRPHILRSGVGQLSEFDIEHAAAAKGHLINFNTPIDANISRLAEENKVSILDHNIIYRLVDDVKAELSKHLPPLITQKVMGEAEVAQIFSITVKGRQQKAIAGCKVRNGTISKTAKVRVLRGGQKVFDGSLESLKNVKKDVSEMKKGGECGIGFEGWFDFQVGDQIQTYEEIHEKRSL